MVVVLTSKYDTSSLIWYSRNSARGARDMSDPTRRLSPEWNNTREILDKYSIAFWWFKFPVSYLQLTFKKFYFQVTVQFKLLYWLEEYYS